MPVRYAGDVDFAPNGTPNFIGDTGTGSLVVNRGAFERWDIGGTVGGPRQFVILANDTGSAGTVTVTGMDSVLAVETQGFSGVQVGRLGSGAIQVLSGGTLNIGDDDSANDAIRLSFNEVATNVFTPGSAGRLTVDDGTLTMQGLETQITSTGAGTTTDIDIRNGSTVTLEGNTFAGVQLGRGGQADLSVSGGSVVTLDNTRTIDTRLDIEPGTFFNLGRDGGTADAVVDGSTVELFSDFFSGASIGRSGAGSGGSLDLTNSSTLDIRAGDDSAFLNVGRADAVGTMTVTDSTVLMNATGAGTQAIARIGRDGGTGTLTLDGSTMTLLSLDDVATLQIGSATATEDGGTGTATFDGSRINVRGDTSLLAVANGADTEGALEVLSGSTIQLADFGRQASGSLFTIGSTGSLSATALIDGQGSLVNGVDLTLVGAGSGASLGAGTLTISNEAALTSSDVTVAENGSLILQDATITLGAFSFTRDVPGTLTVEGAISIEDDLSVGRGTVNLDGADVTFRLDADDFDGSGVITPIFTHQGGRFVVDAETGFVIDASTYTFAEGDAAFLLNTEDEALATIIRNNDFAVTGQDADFGWILISESEADFGSDVIFAALNDGVGGGRADLDIDARNPDGLRFGYRTGEERGFGVLDDGSQVAGFNLDGIRGGAAGDRIAVLGSEGLLLDGRGGRDRLSGGSGDDTIRGGDGNDVLVGGAGGDILAGGTGFDVVSYASATGGIVVDLADAAANAGDAAGDALTAIEVVRGSELADTLSGDAAGNRLLGGGGDDLIAGQSGNDRLDGGAGDDLLIGGAGSDLLGGGAGIDTASYADAAGGVLVDLILAARNMGDAAGDRYQSIENIDGSAFADRISGTQGTNVLVGNGGDDILLGRGGNDTIAGGAGDDILIGSEGADLLIGGGGRDTFTFSNLEAMDTVRDFRPGLDLVRFEDRVFTALSPGAFSADNFRVGAARDADDFVLYDAGTGVLSYDADGSGAGAAVAIATFTGAPMLSEADIFVV